jgi:DNA-binding response OmpR family regulator
MKCEYQIALIDDDEAWVSALADYLDRHGFSTRTAHVGSDGLSLLESGTVAVALVDLNMPDMNGLEVMRRLRQRSSELTVILVSSDDDPFLAARVKAAGGQGFLPKNASPGLLLETVRRALAAALSRAQEHFHDRPWRYLLPAPSLPWRFLLTGPHGHEHVTAGPSLN